MDDTGRGPSVSQPAGGSVRKLRRRFRVAIMRGRLDVHNPRRQSFRAAMERQFSDQDAKRIERRYLEWRRRCTAVNQWLQEGIPHAEEVVQIDGAHHLEAALSGGTGAILASVHFGHGRLIRPILRLRGWPALLVGGRASERWPEAAAHDLPVTLNLRPHLAALRANKPIIILVDGHAAVSVIRMPVLGIGCHFAPGTMRIARVAGAPVLPTFVVDEGTLRDPLAIRVVIHPPLALECTEDPAADALENLSRFAAVYAQELMRNPHLIHWREMKEDGEFRPSRGRIVRDRWADRAVSPELGSP